MHDRDLAVFLADTVELDAYLSDLYWAQEYAARNRAVMMALFCEVAGREFAARGKDVAFGEQLSAHHTYVAQETHDGVDLVVTRRGDLRGPAVRRGPGFEGAGSCVVTASAKNSSNAPSRTARAEAAGTTVLDMSAGDVVDLRRLGSRSAS